MILNQGKISFTDLSNEFNHKPRFVEHKLSEFYRDNTELVIPNQSTPVVSNTQTIPSSGEIKFSDFRSTDGIRKFPITITPYVHQYWWAYGKSYLTLPNATTRFFYPENSNPESITDSARRAAWPVNYASDGETRPLYAYNDQWIMTTVRDEYLTTFQVYALKDTVINIKIPSSTHVIRGDYDGQGNAANDGASIRRPGYILETEINSSYPTASVLGTSRSDAVVFESLTAVDAIVPEFNYEVNVNKIIEEYPASNDHWKAWAAGSSTSDEYKESVHYLRFVIRPVCDTMRNDDDASLMRWIMPSINVETSRLDAPDIIIPTKRGPQTV